MCRRIELLLSPRCDKLLRAQAYIAKLKTSVKRTGALTAAQSRHVSGMLDALAHCASYPQDAVAVERPEAASAVAANAADEVKAHVLSYCCIWPKADTPACT